MTLTALRAFTLPKTMGVSEAEPEDAFSRALTSPNAMVRDRMHKEGMSDTHPKVDLSEAGS